VIKERTWIELLKLGQDVVNAMRKGLQSKNGLRAADIWLSTVYGRNAAAQAQSKPVIPQIVISVNTGLPKQADTAITVTGTAETVNRSVDPAITSQLSNLAVTAREEMANSAQSSTDNSSDNTGNAGFIDSDDTDGTADVICKDDGISVCVANDSTDQTPQAK